MKKACNMPFSGYSKHLSVIFFIVLINVLANKSIGQESMQVDASPTLICGIDQYMNKRFKDDPGLENKFIKLQDQFFDDVAMRIACDGTNNVAIPLAFHFDRSFSCSDEVCILSKVNEQIDVLNNAFADNSSSTNAANCPAAYPSISTGSCISFYLAEPPSCANSAGTSCAAAITIGEFQGGYAALGNGLGNYGAGACWDDYLNVFIQTTGSRFGVSDQIPDALPANGSGEGVTVKSEVFGGPGDPCGNLDTSNSYNLGVILVHEIGHYLGLWHTFQDGCADERNNTFNGIPINVDDTPPQANPFFGCTTACVASDCGAGFQQTANFMNYSDNACTDLFSEDQAAVMNIVANGLFGNLSIPAAPSNLSSILGLCHAEQCSRNLVELLDPPLTVKPNTLVDVIVSYNNTENIDALVLVRFKSSTGVDLGQDMMQVASGQGTVSLQLLSPPNTANDYSYEAQLLSMDGSTILAQSIVINVTVGNSVKLINPPLSVRANELVDVSVSYTNIESTDVLVVLTFLSPNGEQSGQVLIQVPPGQGTVNLQIEAPENSGSGYSYRAVLLSPESGDILLVEIVDNVTVGLPGGDGSSIALINPPTIVQSEDLVDMSLDYNNAASTNAYAVVRLKSPSGDNIEFDYVQVPPGEGSVTLQLVVPAITGSNYSYQAVLMILETGEVLAEDNVPNVTITAPGNNFINLVNPLTTVTANELVDVTLNYNNSPALNAFCRVRFVSPTGDLLGLDYVVVTPGEGTRLLQVVAPEVAGSGYSYQAELIQWDTWIVLAEQIVNNVTVEAATSFNKITMINPPTVVSANELVDITVNYENIEGTDVYAFVRFIGPSGIFLGQDLKQVSLSSGTEILQVPAPVTVGTGYTLQARLLRIPTFDKLAEDLLNNVLVNLPSDCLTDIIQTGNVVISNSQYAQNSIISDGVVLSGSDIEFTAANHIEMLENFEVELGALFHAYLESCSN